MIQTDCALRRSRPAFVLVVGGLVTLFAAHGCGKGDEKSGEPAQNGSAAATQQEGGYAVGRVTMADGKPITAPGASITIGISGVSGAGERVSYSPAVKPDGTYKQKLAAGSYRFERSTVSVDFNGKQYRLHLEPVGDNWNKNRESADGITQDFVWKLTGERQGGDHDVNNHTNWHGGSIGVRLSGWRNDINQAPPQLPDGTPITFTLRPTSPKQLDGAEARPITLERKYNARWTKCDALHDIPVADYELTGVAKLADGTTKPLLFEVEYAKYKPAQPVRFDPDTTMNHVTTLLTAWVTE